MAIPLVSALWYLAIGFAGVMAFFALVALFQGKPLQAGLLFAVGVLGALGLLYFAFGPGASVVANIYGNLTAIPTS